MENSKLILHHILEESKLPNGKLYRIKKGTKLHLVCHPYLLNKNIRIFCNLPQNLNEIINDFKFKRDKFYEYKWIKDKNQNNNDNFDKYVEIDFLIAGSFQFDFLIDQNECIEFDQKCSKGGAEILVEPELKLSNGQIIDLNCLQIQTVLPKLLGSLDEWESRLRISKESGYNMIHFTPIEELSRQSFSSYSLRDHRKLNENASSNGKHNFNDLDKILNKIYHEWNMFSICDLVYNHMSNDAPFLNECPDAAYNLENSKFLRPAFLFDRMLYYLSKNIENGLYESIGIKKNEFTFNNLEQVKDLLINDLVPNFRFEEFYCMNIDEILNEINEILLKNNFNSNFDENLLDLWKNLLIIQDEDYRRLKSNVDFDIVKKIIAKELNNFDSNNENNFNEIILDKFRQHFMFLNDVKKNEIYLWINNGVDNVYLSAKYHFFADDGPKYKSITKKTPLITLYFNYPFDDSSLEQDEKEIYELNSNKGKYIMAHNGWVMNQDPLVNFASKDSLVYIKRELLAWGDSVKLRYGEKPEDSPGLWEYMSNYTLNIAKMFHGVRLDNCHNTPIHVAQYFLDLARSIRPDLYVIAELFTNSSFTDNIFVSKLGITSLIRESINAWNAREFSRLLHRFGGDPVGSFKQPNVRPLKESLTHAVFFDITHDNKSLIKAHTVHDTLSRSALILMCGCAYGSTRGYDELVPHEIDVVKEKRSYSRWMPDKNDNYKTFDNEKFINFNSGIIKAKNALNKLHFEMGTNGYNEIFVDLLDDEVIAITRSNPDTHQSYILLSRTAFYHPNGYSTIKEFKVPLKLKNILFEAILVEDKVNDYTMNEHYINGLENYSLKYQENLTDISKSYFIQNLYTAKNETVFHFKNLPPGAIIGFSFGIDSELLQPIQKFRSNIKMLSLANNKSNDLYNILDRLTFDELNILLFRVAEEEIDENISSSVYVIPNYGPLLFCGLQGFMNILEKVRLYNDLGHPIFQNLRDGNWMMEYIVRRLKSSCQNNSNRKALLDLSHWLETQFNLLYNLSRFMIPAYFDVIMSSLYSKVLDCCFKLMSFQKNSLISQNFILNGSSFIHSLALTSIQFVGASNSARLPNTLVIGSSNEYLLSIAAGLPFFSHGIMRNWGRDTFISLKGLLLLTNRFEDAKNLILTYGSCLRHGLIPNLLGEGICARYNARDAIWWWLKGIKDYTECVQDGYKILDEEVYRLYPHDDSPYDIRNSPKQKLSFIIQEALTIHVNGLNFIERNAGPQIDDHMREEGFHNSIGIDFNTGFVFGGNKYNCGTWMDKNGSSVKAGINGLPATPRDGSAVELVGLNRCILEWLIKINNDGHYEYNGVKLNDKNKESQKLEKFTWVEWAARIDKNFEKYFWIDLNSNESSYINKREIYKDTLNSSIPWADYQFRPNFLIAICLAPQMVNSENALKALNKVRENLLNSPNSIGIKTLDPSDYTYNGFYDNSNDSDDPKIAHGYNYHNGPEWLWPTGYYLRSVIKYSKENERENNLNHIQSYLSKYYLTLKNSDWKGLPELTNENGQDCVFSCPSQAWSIASILEVCYDLITF